MEFLNNRLLGVLMSLSFFELGKFIFKKTNFPLFNPLLIAATSCISVLYIFNIPLESYLKGADIIEFFLAPATVILVIPLYKQLDELKEYYFPILVGGLIGSITAIVSICIIGKFLGIDKQIIVSMMPKSITTPFGIEASKMIGGIPSITVFGIIITGITGNILAVPIFKMMGDIHPVAKGVGIGVSSHAVGTSRAIEIGKTEGAMSALSIIVAGVITTIILQIGLYFI